MGAPLKIAQRIQVGLPLTVLESYVELLGEFEFEERDRELTGRARAGRGGGRDHAVELPAAPDRRQGRARARGRLHRGAQAERGRAAAAYALAEVVDAAGLPAGRVEPLSGTGRSSVRPWRRTPVSTSCRSPARRAPGPGRRARGRVDQAGGLELGGKSANVILDDADLDQAVKPGVGNGFLNGGQTCTAWTRMLVPAAGIDEAASRPGVAEAFRPGDPFDESTRSSGRCRRRPSASGCAATSAGRRRRRAARGRRPRPPDGLDTRLLRPADGVHRRQPDMAIAQEESSGRCSRSSPTSTRRGRRDRERHDLRPRRRRSGRPTPSGPGGRAAAAHRAGQRERRRLQPARPVRRLQAVGHRARARPFGLEEFLEVKSIQR